MLRVDFQSHTYVGIILVERLIPSKPNPQPCAQHVDRVVEIAVSQVRRRESRLSHLLSEGPEPRPYLLGDALIHQVDQIRESLQPHEKLGREARWCCHMRLLQVPIELPCPAALSSVDLFQFVTDCVVHIAPTSGPEPHMPHAELVYDFLSILRV